MPEYKGFVGGSYPAQSRIAAADECINFYVEKLETANPKSAAMLVGTPGLALFAALPAGLGFNQGQYFTLGRMFSVTGGVLYEVFADGTFKKRGVCSPNGPVLFTCNNVQLVVALAGGIATQGWVLTLKNNVFAPITAPGFSGASSLSFIDSYVLAPQPGTRLFNITALEDATSWDGLDVAVKEGGSDNIVTGFADHLEYWLLGEETSEVWWDSGNANFPFQRIQGSFIECGCAAAQSPAKFDNSFGWLGKNQRGQGIVYRANGYTPLRISTHAVEFAIAQYPRIDDAIGSSHQIFGHEFYRLDFPSANPPKAPGGIPAGATWLYDASTQLWHQRAFWNTQFARFEAHRGRYHCFAFGKHLVGDYASSNIYEMNAAFLDDFGNPLRSVRTAPHQYSEATRNFYSELWFDIAVGAGLPNGQAAKAALQLSNDGGETWGNEQWASLGPVGKYQQRVKYRRLGQARDRVCRLIMTDPVQRFVVGAYFSGEAGTN